MKAHVYQGPSKSSWTEAPIPKIIDASDVIVRVELTTICSCDLRILSGGVPDVSFGTILGHEALGTVTEAGSSVRRVKVGDRVLVSCITSCGTCEFCRRSRYGQCDGGGGWILGHLIDGTQAEFVRVPFADTSTYAIPPNVSDEAILMIADILPTAYEVGVLLGTVHPGDDVVVIGAGPVGLAAVATASLVSLVSPDSIIVINVDDARLTLAKDFGANLTINSLLVDPLSEVMRLTADDGAHVVIEAVGRPETFELATTLTRRVGHLANIGIHGSPVPLHLEKIWSHDMTITTGLVDTFSIPTLIRLVASGQLRAGDFVTHRYDFDHVVEAYDVVARAKETGALKVVLGETPTPAAA